MESSIIPNKTITYGSIKKTPTFHKDQYSDSALLPSELLLTYLTGNLRKTPEGNPNRAAPFFQLNERPSKQESRMRGPTDSFSESMREVHITFCPHI